MTKPALMLLYSTFARIACLQRTACDLRMLQDSAERARSLPASEAWHRKVAAHAQFHCLLADASGAPAFALLARFVSGSMHDMIALAGPAAEDMIIASRRRLLGHLEMRDADGAAQEMDDYLTRLYCAAAQTAKVTPQSRRLQQLGHSGLDQPEELAS